MWKSVANLHEGEQHPLHPYVHHAVTSRHVTLRYVTLRSLLDPTENADKIILKKTLIKLKSIEIPIGDDSKLKLKQNGGKSLNDGNQQKLLRKKRSRQTEKGNHRIAGSQCV